MNETPKKKAPWKREAVTQSFHYEVEGALEVIVHAVRTAYSWSWGTYNPYSVEVGPMHPELLEHPFTFSTDSSDKKQKVVVVRGRIFQVTERTCIIEGLIYTDESAFGRDLATALLVGLGATAATSLVGCLPPAAGIVFTLFLLAVVYRQPASTAASLGAILDGMAKSLREIRHPYRLIAESPYPRQAPKHSRPAAKPEKRAREKPVIQKINLLDDAERDDKTKPTGKTKTQG